MNRHLIAVAFGTASTLSAGADANAYDVVTEFKKGDGWTTAWTVRMRKLPAKPGS